MTGTMTYLRAAEHVLREHSPGAPMHYRRITELAINDGVIAPSGATPEATMVAQLSTDIKRREATGRAPRFRAYGRGLYGLAVPTDPLGGAIDRHNEVVRERLRVSLGTMDPQAFEHLIASLLSILGFEDVEVTKYSGDGGIDVRATLTVGGVTDVRTAVQVKRWANNVSGRTVRELRGGLGPHERGLIITLSGFTRDARSEAAAGDRSPVTLIDGEQLLGLLVENEIGVATRTVPIHQLDEASLSLVDEESPEEAESPVQAPRPPVAGTYAGEKALSMWPLPGGRLAWKETLDVLLRHIAESAPSMEEMVDWIIATFDRVASLKVARGYVVSVLRPLDLVETEGEQLALTTTGAQYLADPSDATLLDIACRNVAGYDEILAAIDAEPQSPQELLEHLREELGVGWETDTQVRFRLTWLENLGRAKESEGRWTGYRQPRTA